MSGDLQSFYRKWIRQAEARLVAGQLSEAGALIKQCRDLDAEAAATNRTDGPADGAMSADTWQAFDSLCCRFAEVTR